MNTLTRHIPSFIFLVALIVCAVSTVEYALSDKPLEALVTFIGTLAFIGALVVYQAEITPGIEGDADETSN